MSLAVIVNGITSGRHTFYRQALPELQRRFECVVKETTAPGDAVTLAKQSVFEGHAAIVAVGGDGTVHQVVNGMLQSGVSAAELPSLAVYPLGTGNDFARSFRLTPHTAQLLRLLETNQPSLLDVGHITYTTSEGNAAQRYFINVADAGMGPEVVAEVMRSSRRGGALAYYQAIIKTFFSYTPRQVSVQSDDWTWQGPVRTIAIANARFYGQGLCVAPEGRADDGILNLFIAGKVSVLDFILQTAPLKRGHYVRHPAVWYQQGRAIRLQSEEKCAIEADGEWLGYLPATVRVLPSRIRVLL